MLRELILSFIKQDYQDSELCIVDDHSEDETAKVVQQFRSKDSRINYYYNETNLGYCKNLLRTIILSQGRYVLVLGDDDMLLEKNALRKYVEVFDQNPDVYFIECNLVQINKFSQPDFAYTRVKQDTKFSPGVESFNGLWLDSLLITGIGIRKFSSMEELYPQRTLLFPQMEFVGRIMLDHSSFGISDYLVAFRAHFNNQLGYFAIKKERIKSTEQHGNIEIPLILANLLMEDQKAIKETEGIARRYVRSIATDILNEKIFNGNTATTRNLIYLLHWNNKVAFSPTLWISLIGSILVPSFILSILKNEIKSHLATRRYRNEIDISSRRLREILGK